MKKTAAERIKLLAELLSQKAEEIRGRTQRSDGNGNSHTRFDCGTCT
ncbi:hypothetical protein ACS127_17185 [Amphibacillus sp. Q70]